MSRFTTAARLGLKEALFPQKRYGYAWFAPPGGYVEGMLSEVGDGRGNSAVEAVLGYLARTFPEAPLRVHETKDAATTLVDDHPVHRLLDRPNPAMIGADLDYFSVVSRRAEGNAYIWKRRSAAGIVVELWPLMPDLVTPKGNPQSAEMTDQWIDHYEYRPQGQLIRIPREDIIHHREGFDPDDPRRGYAALKSVLREILGDEAAGQFSVALLRNMGIPGVIISPKDGEGPASDEADEMEQKWAEKYGRSGKGTPYVVRGGAVNVDVVGFSPEQMNFRDLARLPEERISGVLGVPAILAGLGAGLERAIESNLKGLREHYTETTLVPDWKTDAARWTIGLLREYDEDEDRVLARDLRDVRALQEDQNALYERQSTMIEGVFGTLADARRAVGLPVTDAHEVFVLPAGKMLVTEDGLTADLDTLPPEGESDEGEGT